LGKTVPKKKKRNKGKKKNIKGHFTPGRGKRPKWRKKVLAIKAVNWGGGGSLKIIQKKGGKNARTSVKK